LLEYQYSFEFRDKTWFHDEVYNIFRKHQAALCIYNVSDFVSAKELTADYTYIQLHGPGNAHEGTYEVQTLAGWAGELFFLSRQGISVYYYLENDQRGHATQNAQRLQ
jgi:uncharacterized protein YecE (DUF72 family)